MVHKLAELDGMPKGLKIANRANQILFDSAWMIAGVDYDEELFNDEDYNNEDDKEEDESYDMVEEYDEMDKNELANLGEEAHGFNVPNEGNCTEQQPVFNNKEEEILFVEPNNDNEPAEINASEFEYKDSENEDESLDADAEEEDTNPSLR
jgi:hypothetical protein